MEKNYGCCKNIKSLGKIYKDKTTCKKCRREILETIDGLYVIYNKKKEILKTNCNNNKSHISDL